MSYKISVSGLFLFAHMLLEQVIFLFTLIIEYVQLNMKIDCLDSMKENMLGPHAFIWFQFIIEMSALQMWH